MRRFLRFIPDGGGVNVIDPNSIPGWIAIHDSRSIPVQADDTPVLVWPDTSGNGRHAIPFLGFTGNYRVGNGLGGTPKGQPTVDFSGNRTMTYPLPAAPGIIDTTLGFNYICWMQQLNVTTLDQVFLNGPVAENFQARSVEAVVAVEMNVDGAGIIVANPVSDPMTVGNHILEFIGVPPWGTTAGGHTEIWQDGRRVAFSTTAGWTTRPNTNMFFSEVQAGVDQRIAWAGYIGRDLGPGIRAGIRGWLKSQFGGTA